MMQISSTPLSFTSKIKFVSKDCFEEKTSHIERDTYGDYRYIGNPWNSARALKDSLTDGAFACTAGGVTDSEKKNMVLFHITPKGFMQYREILCKKFDEFIEKASKPAGLLVCGTNETSVFENIKNALNNLKKSSKFDYSEFTLLRQGGKVDLYYESDSDTWYVHYDNSGTNKELFHTSTPAGIKKVFKEIHIAKGDHVYIGDQTQDEVSAEELETN